MVVNYRDARWEVGVDYASEESKYCLAAMCMCPEGRSHSPQIGCVLVIPSELASYAMFSPCSQYRMRKCRTCGQCRGHVECLRGDKTNECQDCSTTSDMGSSSSEVMACSTVSTAVGEPVRGVKTPSTAVRGAKVKGVSMAGKATSTVASRHKVLVLSLKRLNSKDILLMNSHK